ncbi:origin recognition complex subunit 2 isoform X2 [Aplysia californica]|uniref:Origin recognition complex subunit 2 n=1 Tax=Aplysia californica TaxID=6500 RepID=A0ABM1A360_APLCA|nr:origin recognition complex subunit 2 isoform X2 [Aplysia californica]
MEEKRKKSIRITEVSEDAVIQHILPLNDLTRVKRRGRNSGASSQDLVYTATEYNGDSDSDEDAELSIPNGVQPMETEIEENAMFGGEVFRFRTQKKSGQMVMKAEDCVSPRTPGKKTPGRGSKSAKSTPTDGVLPSKTPPRSQRVTEKQQSAAASPARTAIGEAAPRDHKRMESSTPYRLRKRNLQLEQAESSSDDSVDESSDEEEENGVGKNSNSGFEAQSTGGSGGSMNTTATAEAYFDLHSMAPVTSDRTLANLDGPRMDVSAVREALKSVTPGHRKETKALREKHEQCYGKWMLNMCHGYNILLYGLGSKRSLLDDFRTKHIAKYSHLVVNGYFPSLTVKQILNSITEEILGETHTGFSNPFAHIKFIKNAYKNKDEDFFLVIHNIDGILLRSERAQAVLSLLAEVEGFHIVASIDHINAPFLWDQNKYFRFRWLWFETATFLPYESENAYENSLLVQQSGALALSSILHVMHSLTPNGRRVFLLLARHQMEACDNSAYIGMSFQSLYQQCRESFLVNSDLTLQAQLVEFRDHRLIRSRKNYEGIEHLQIPVDKSTLTEFLNEYKEGSS